MENTHGLKTPSPYSRSKYFHRKPGGSRSRLIRPPGSLLASSSTAPSLGAPLDDVMSLSSDRDLDTLACWQGMSEYPPDFATTRHTQVTRKSTLLGGTASYQRFAQSRAVLPANHIDGLNVRCLHV